MKWTWLLVVACGLSLDSREALQACNEWIGQWKGAGTSDRPKATWSEEIDWSWRFKRDDTYLQLTVRNGRRLHGGELRYSADKQRYEFKSRGMDGKERLYVGQFQKAVLTLEHVDPESKETQRLVMNSAGDGARWVYRMEKRHPGSSVFAREAQVASTKVGESLVQKGPKVECIVSGGLGTIQVSYKGTTYHVCCGGCRDAFNENPEKYIKEFEEKKSGKR
jgi:hypothetical protein